MLGRVLLIALFTVVAGSAAFAQMSDAEFTKFIQARADKFGEAFNKHDSATIAALYSEDAVRVAPTGIQHGRAEIGKSLENGFKNNNSREFVAVVEQAHQYGDEGWAVGSFSLTISVPGNEAVQAKGLWADVYERRGDQWFARVDSYNNPPPPPPKPAQ